MTEEVVGVLETTKTLLRDAMLEEYQHGFNDAYNVISAGLTASFEKAKTLVGAEAYLPGIEMTIGIMAEMKEDMLAKIRAQDAEIDAKS